MENAKLTVKEAAEFLGVSSSTLRNWQRHGYIKPFSNSRPRLFKTSHIYSLQKQILNGSLKRLNTRANKHYSQKSFIPSEYLSSSEDISKINAIKDITSSADFDLKIAIDILCLNFLRSKGFLRVETNPLSQMTFLNDQVGSEFDKDQINRLLKNSPFAAELLNAQLPNHFDPVGLVYQCIKTEGSKSVSGSYYTPPAIIQDMANQHVEDNTRILDPCCGSGNFLLHFADKLDSPDYLCGTDIDPLAVKIARINLILKFPDKTFKPKIYTADFLHDDLTNIFDFKFDLISTNPPWGMKIQNKNKQKLRLAYPQIKSHESASMFICRALEMLETAGKLSFILPESIIKTRTHEDIRKVLLKKASLDKIVWFGKVFDRVSSNAIRLDAAPKRETQNLCTIIKRGQSWTVDTDRFNSNRYSIFDINTNQIDQDIISKVFSVPHNTLADNAAWALGIVTGNNDHHLKEICFADHEPIIRGRDIERYKISPPQVFIKFEPKLFQQCAKEDYYRTGEKLIYRFIGKRLCFAYDSTAALTLNSANILIPDPEFYPILAVQALFNSSLYQFMFSKKFDAIKILRTHLEALPLPKWPSHDIAKLAEYAKLLNESYESELYRELDLFVMERFGLDDSQMSHVLKNVK